MLFHTKYWKSLSKFLNNSAEQTFKYKKKELITINYIESSRVWSVN